MSNFTIGQVIDIKGKAYTIVGVTGRSIILEHKGKRYYWIDMAVNNI